MTGLRKGRPLASGRWSAPVAQVSTCRLAGKTRRRQVETCPTRTTRTWSLARLRRRRSLGSGGRRGLGSFGRADGHGGPVGELCLARHDDLRILGERADDLDPAGALQAGLDVD